jgi:hypothetical protein
MTVKRNNPLRRIAVGMSLAIDYSEGALLLIDTINKEVVATSLDASGRKREVWRGAGSMSSHGLPVRRSPRRSKKIILHQASHTSTNRWLASSSARA